MHAEKVSIAELFSQLASSPVFEQMEPEVQMAWRFLWILLSDCQHSNPKRRRRYIAETRAWLADDARGARFRPGKEGFAYSFSHWCELLGIESEGYMARKLEEWLKEREKEVE